MQKKIWQLSLLTLKFPKTEWFLVGNNSSYTCNTFLLSIQKVDSLSQWILIKFFIFLIFVVFNYLFIQDTKPCQKKKTWKLLLCQFCMLHSHSFQFPFCSEEMSLLRAICWFWVLFPVTHAFYSQSPHLCI